MPRKKCHLLIELMKPSGKILFVEDFPLSEPLPECSQIVSLTPEASFQLQQRGIPFFILEDFYEEKALQSFDDVYFEDQIRWLEELESYLAGKIPVLREYGFKIVRFQYYQIKYVLDSFVSAAFIFKTFLEKAQPASIEFLSARDLMAAPLTQHIYALEVNDRRYWWPVLNQVCQTYSVPLKRTVFKQAPDARQAYDAKPPRRRPAAFGAVRDLAVAFYDMVRYSKVTHRAGRQKDYGSMNCLFLHAYERDVGETLKTLIQRGSRVYLKKESSIYEISRFVSRKVLDTSEAADAHKSALQTDFQAAAAELTKQDALWEWFKMWTGESDLRDFLIPCFQQFITETCREIVSEALPLRDFCASQKIHYVIARAATEKISLSALLAADSLEESASVCFQHGADTRTSKVLLKSESDPFDIYFAMDSDSREFMEAGQSASYLKPCRVFQYPDFLRTFGARPPVNCETIMHVAARPNVSVRMLNAMDYSAVKYYQLQVRLLDFYGTQTSRSFIYKYVPRASDWIYEATLRYIAEEKKHGRLANITTEDRPLRECYDRAGRIVIDFPGTAMYEVAAAGIPFVTLCPDHIKNRPASQQLFGKTLRSFASPDEAVAILENFFESPPEQYRINLTPQGDSPAAELLRLFLAGTFKKENVCESR